MLPSLTIKDLVEMHHDNLQLSWVLGEEHNHRALHKTPDDAAALVGFLNFIHPPQITLFGMQEFHYLANLDVSAYQEAIKQFFDASPSVIILCDEQNATDEILQSAQERSIPVLKTPLSATSVLNHLSHKLSAHFAESITVHGVFLEVFDLGVLLTGASGVGKSELALELINRGHRLIADDSPVFYKDSPESLTGSSPPLLKDFLEVRGLGIINVRAMFGNTAVKQQKKLNLIVHVITMSDPIVATIDRLEGLHKTKNILNVPIPEVTLPAGAGRSLSVLVEAAVHNQVLRKSGYNASALFANRQQKAIQSAS